MQRKLYPNLVYAVIDILGEIMLRGSYADKSIEAVFRQNKKWGSRDRGFIAEAVYEIVRYKRLFEFILGIENITFPDIDNVFKVWYWWKNKELPAIPEGEEIDTELWLKRLTESEEMPVISQSFPDWLADIIKQDYPESWEQILKSLNQESEVAIRCNTLKCTPDQLIESLAKEDIHIRAAYPPNGFVLEKRANVFRTKVFKEGWFEVQDISSQHVGDFLGISPGMQVFDACAGAGGKSLQMAAMTEGKGRVLSLDVEAYKLAELKRRAKRAGAGNIETRIIESNKTIKRLKDKADRLLLDVPCTGTGVIRRNPDTKWKINAERLEELIGIQSDILTRYAGMLKPKGAMVYATCSILKCENEIQVNNFLKANPDFTLEKELTLLPHVDGFDGFYMARMVKS